MRPHRLLSVAQRITSKLAPRYYGPFRVVKKLGLVTYRLHLPPNFKIHPVFHIFLLKRAVVTLTIDAILPKEFTLEEVDLLTPNKILANQSIRQQDASIKQFLIQWNNKPVEEATWEEELTLKSKFQISVLRIRLCWIWERWEGLVEVRKRGQLEHEVTTSLGSCKEWVRGVLSRLILELLKGRSLWVVPLAQIYYFPCCLY